MEYAIAEFVSMKEVCDTLVRSNYDRKVHRVRDVSCTEARLFAALETLIGRVTSSTASKSWATAAARAQAR